MASRLPVKTRRHTRHNRIGALLVLLVVVAVSALVYFRFYGPFQQACAAGAVGLTAIIVDSTDSLDAVQRLSLRNELMEIVDSVPVGHAIQLWRILPITDDVPSPETEAVCNPGETASPWFANPAQVERAYSETFYRPLQSAIDSLLSQSPQSQSPIMESIQAISLRAFTGPQARTFFAKRLVVASDLLQHTPSFSQLRTELTFADFKLGPAFTKLAADLTNVDVSILYLRRAGSSQGRSHIEFWQEYIAACGGRITSVKSVAGLN